MSPKIVDSWMSDIDSIINNDALCGWEIIENVFKLITKSDGEAPSILRYFFEKVENRSINCTKRPRTRYSRSQEQNHLESFEKEGIFDRIDEIFLQNQEPDLFYANLWDLISNSSLTTKKEKVLLLFVVWQSPRIPYFQLPDGLKMTKEDFLNVWNAIQEVLTKARFIIFSRFRQRTEEASLLVDLMKGLKKREEKAVFLAVIVSLVESRTKNELSQE